MTEYRGYTFEYHHKFQKEFNKILTKHHCPTLKDDFKLLYDILIQHLNESDRFAPHICMHISGLQNNVTVPASRSGFRITFLFDQDESKFIFVEIFNKNKKEIPDKNRINELFVKKLIFERNYMMVKRNI